MAAEDDTNKILEYLKKHSQTNTFRLATELGIDRNRILNIIKRLEEKQAIEVKSGIVRFLKFPVKEKRLKKKIVKVKKALHKPKKKIKHKKTALEIFQAENIRLKERILELEADIKRQANIKNKKLREEAEIINKLQQKASAPPKIIRRTTIKNVPVVKKVYVKSKKLEEQTEYIKELEEKIKELQSAPPKVIRRTVVKKVPVKVNEKPIKEEIKPRKFKLPKINFSWLNKNIKRLHVPETLRNP